MKPDKKKSTDWELDLQIIHQLGPIKKKLDPMFHHGQEDTKKNLCEPSGSPTFGPAVSRGSFGLYLKIHCMAWTVVKVLGIWRPQIDIPSGKLTPIAMENSPF
jgi:hypothetical protein